MLCEILNPKLSETVKTEGKKQITKGKTVITKEKNLHVTATNKLAELVS